jgi:lysophospholipase L1-like esterase
MSADRSKPVFLITIYPNSADYFLNGTAPVFEANQQFIRAIQDIHREFNRPNLHLIEGSDLLNDFHALASDLIHPSDYGHMLIGERLAARMSHLI